jgi:hypothetical protein
MTDEDSTNMLCEDMCSLNDLPYDQWPERHPTSAEEVAQEDELSRRLRMCLERPLKLISAAHGNDNLKDEERKAEIKLLTGLQGFAVAARNSGWAMGQLPIVFQLQYVPRECNKEVCHKSH